MIMRFYHPDAKHEKELREKVGAGSQEYDDYRALAEILLNAAGREDEGLAVLDQALKLPLPDSERAAIAADVAWWLYELGREEQATTTAQRALSHIAGQAETPEVLIIRGLSHATLAFCRYSADRAASDRDARLALEVFERHLSECPDSENFVVVCLYAARVYVLRQEYMKAIALYETAMQSDPSVWNRLNCLVYLGNALRCQDRYAEAEGCLREALALAETDRRLRTWIYFELGKVQRLTNRPEEAVVAFEQALRALDISPVMRRDRVLVAEIRWELGNLYYDARRYGEAVVALREALPDLPKPAPYFDTLISLGHCYLVTGQYARARECYEEVLASDQASKEEKAISQEGLSRLPPLSPPY